MRSNKVVAEKIQKMKELERIKKQVETEIEEIKSDLKEELKTRNKSEMLVEGYIVKIVKTCTTSFDTKAFKEDFDKLYNKYCNQREGERFYVLKEGK